jgi:hypothetical protein
MKKQDNVIRQLEKLVEEDFDRIKENLIFCDNGQYHLFNRYIIVKKFNGTVDVLKHLHDPKNFSTLRIALSWCIADKYQQSQLAYRLLQLDQEKLRIFNDVQVRQGLLKNIADSERLELVKLKISTKKYSLAGVEQQLTKCVNLAKYWQIQGFNRDETARTRHTQPTR